MLEFSSGQGEVPRDALFLERLDTFMHKSLGDIKTFAEREGRPYEETRHLVAQWHAKYLFQAPQTKAKHVHSTLCDTSRILEALAEASGAQSFVLAVDPNEPADAGFLGGSVIGREFWRGMRGGGDPGARAFKTHCATHLRSSSNPPAEKISAPTLPPPLKAGLAKSLKTELYERMRSALRLASGVRTAEMKWTNPERLDVFGVTLVGWPEGIPAQNPSSLKVSQNKLLLEGLEKGTLRFERINSAIKQPAVDEETPPAAAPEEDFSWAYDADADADAASTSPSQPLDTVPPSTGTSESVPPSEPAEPLDDDDGPMSWDLQEPLDDLDVHETGIASSFSVYYSWGDGDMNENMLSDSLTADSWNDELLERPRKRQRSEEVYPASPGFE